MKTLILGVAAAALAVAARPDQAVQRIISERPAEGGRWSLVLERTVQPAEGADAELLNPGDLALADDGSLAVFEPKPAHVKIFSAAGAHLRSVGREGSGPGEFRTGYIALRGDTLVVQDPRQGRAVMLNWKTGATIGGILTARNYFFPIAIDGSGRAVVRTIAASRDTTLVSQGFVRFDVQGKRADTIWVHERRPRSESKSWLVRDGDVIRMGVPIPLQPAAVYAVDPSGTFVTGWSGEYLLRVTRSGRDTAMLFGRTFTPSAVSRSEKSALVNRAVARTRENQLDAPEAALRAAFDVSLIPDRRPAFDAIHVDRAGRRWVRLATADSSTVTFDLFGVDGRWLDAVRVSAAAWPREPWQPVAFNRTHAAVIVEDDDGRPAIHVYRISHK